MKYIIKIHAIIYIIYNIDSYLKQQQQQHPNQLKIQQYRCRENIRLDLSHSLFSFSFMEFRLCVYLYSLFMSGG